jgi:hypothetical protein
MWPILCFKKEMASFKFEADVTSIECHELQWTHHITAINRSLGPKASPACLFSRWPRCTWTRSTAAAAAAG